MEIVAADWKDIQIISLLHLCGDLSESMSATEHSWQTDRLNGARPPLRS